MKVLIADVIILDNNKILLVQQRKTEAYGLWSFPGGRVEKDETIEEAVLREVKEELDVKLVEYEFYKLQTIDSRGDKLEIHTFIGKICGNIHLKNDELMSYKWCSLEDVKKMKDSLRSNIIFERCCEAIY